MLGDAWEGQNAENAITEEGNGKAFQPQSTSQLQNIFVTQERN